MKKISKKAYFLEKPFFGSIIGRIFFTTYLTFLGFFTKNNKQKRYAKYFWKYFFRKSP